MKRVNEKQMEEMQREKKQKQPTVEPMEKSLDFWISKAIKYIFNFCCLKEEGSGEFLQMMRCVHVCGFPPCYAHVQTHLELECLFLSLFYGVLDICHLRLQLSILLQNKAQSACCKHSRCTREYYCPVGMTEWKRVRASHFFLFFSFFFFFSA